MGKTSRSAWKAAESAVAKAWSEAIGLLCKRNPLSGANNRNDRGLPRPGDVVVHGDFNDDVLIENKMRSKFMHHKLFREAQKDAKKNGKKHTLLYTRQKYENGYLVIMDADLFHRLLKQPSVQKEFQREKESRT